MQKNTFEMRCLVFCCLLLNGLMLNAQMRYEVASSAEFSAAQNAASSGDTIVWLPGIYSNIRQEIDKNGLCITAIPHGSVLFTGASRTVINADSTTFSGFQYIGGVIGNLDVIKIYGSDVLISQVNIQNYTSHKYLVVDEDSKRTTIRYCNFENRLNLDDKNILSILVDSEPGYHKIQYSSFKNFPGFGNDQGIEPIRIGLSSQGSLNSRTLVEYCYFTKCNGDGEIISHKSRQNVYRYNTFENNPVAELVLRHGDEGIVYGNFFLNNMGGIRIREGSGHYVFNNYFMGLDRRSMFLQNDPSDPLTDIHIYHNTFIDSEELRLGGNGGNPPSNVFIANNVFANPIDGLFAEDTGNEKWTANIAFGKVGIEVPSSGLSELDPLLVENQAGFFQPEINSPLIANASGEFPEIPLYPGMEYDNKILLDLMKEERPIDQMNRAVGASEFSTTVDVEAHVNEYNTGPSYLFENLINYITANASQLYIGNESDSRSIVISSNMEWEVESSSEWISVDSLSGSGNGKLVITFDSNREVDARSGFITISGNDQVVTIDIFQDAGEVLNVDDEFRNGLLVYPNPTEGQIVLENIQKGIFASMIEVFDLEGKMVFSKDFRINNGELVVDLGGLGPGVYILDIKFQSQSENKYKIVKRRIVRL